METSYIKSPINYTGNKFRILDQIIPLFPKNITTFIDVFSGGSTVGINVDADVIIFVDNNIKIINLLKFLANEDINTLINNINELIERYNLTNSSKYGVKKYKLLKDIDKNNGFKRLNKTGYYKLRDDYNKFKDKTTKNANLFLYVLMVYAFNNDIRFNLKNEFNLPVGKTDFNKNNLNKVIAFNKKAKSRKYIYLCADFDSKVVKNYINESTFVYMDPPYLITNAVYNENGGWSMKHEEKLMKFLDFLVSKNISFSLSNVLENKEIKNEILNNWVCNNKITINDIDYHYKSSSYNKKNRNLNEREVLITYFKKNEFE